MILHNIYSLLYQILWYKFVSFSRNTYTKKYGNGVKYRNLDFIILPSYMLFYFESLFLWAAAMVRAYTKTLGTVAGHLRTPGPEFAPIR